MLWCSKVIQSNKITFPIFSLGTSTGIIQGQFWPLMLLLGRHRRQALWIVALELWNFLPNHVPIRMRQYKHQKNYTQLESIHTSIDKPIWIQFGLFIFLGSVLLLPFCFVLGIVFYTMIFVSAFFWCIPEQTYQGFWNRISHQHRHGSTLEQSWWGGIIPLTLGGIDKYIHT